jgi:hypothetical protein
MAPIVLKNCRGGFKTKSYLMSMAIPEYAIFSFYITNRYPLLALVTKTFLDILVNPASFYRTDEFFARYR